MCLLSLLYTSWDHAKEAYNICINYNEKYVDFVQEEQK